MNYLCFNFRSCKLLSRFIWNNGCMKLAKIGLLLLWTLRNSFCFSLVTKSLKFLLISSSRAFFAISRREEIQKDLFIFLIVMIQLFSMYDKIFGWWKIRFFPFFRGNNGFFMFFPVPNLISFQFSHPSKKLWLCRRVQLVLKMSTKSKWNFEMQSFQSIDFNFRPVFIAKNIKWKLKFEYEICWEPFNDVAAVNEIAFRLFNFSTILQQFNVLPHWRWIFQNPVECKMFLLNLLRLFSFRILVIFVSYQCFRFSFLRSQKQIQTQKLTQSC